MRQFSFYFTAFLTKIHGQTANQEYFNSLEYEFLGRVFVSWQKNETDIHGQTVTQEYFNSLEYESLGRVFVSWQTNDAGI